MFLWIEGFRSVRLRAIRPRNMPFAQHQSCEKRET